jgi:hypothetical protein
MRKQTRNRFAAALAFTVAAYGLCAQGLLKNHDFSDGLAGWSALGDSAAFTVGTGPGGETVNSAKQQER